MTQGGDHKTEQLSDFFLSVWSKYGQADVRLVTAGGRGDWYDEGVSSLVVIYIL